MNKKIFIALLFIMCSCCYVFVFQSLEKRRVLYALNNQLQQIKPVVPPALARIVSGEFKGIIADLMTIDAFSALGYYLANDEIRLKSIPDQAWQIIDELLKTSQNLDPYFLDNYQMYQGFFAWYVDAQQAIDFLKVGVDKRYWDPQLLQHIGFNYFYFLDDKEKASVYFRQVYKRSKGSFTYATLSSKFMQQSGKTELAIAFLKDSLKDVPQSSYANKAIEMRLEALQGVFLLEKAMVQYKSAYGVNPPSLHDLIFTGILKDMPKNPYHVQYCLNSDGGIDFDNVECKK